MNTTFPKSIVIGIGGEKHHGKDLLGRMVCAKLNDLLPHSTGATKITHFADSLKERASRIFGVQVHRFHSQELKEEPFAEPIRMDRYLTQMRDDLCLRILPRSLTAHTPRQLAQLFGTEYVRSIDPKFWTDSILDVRDPDATALNLVIPDVRFDDEADAIHAVGGLVVRIVRSDLPPSGETHASEQITFLPDIFVTAKTGEKDKIAFAALIIAETAISRFASSLLNP